MHLFSALGEACRSNVPLRDHSWYQIGGPARWFITPRNHSELTTALTICRDHDLAWRVLGKGANILVRDEGFDGAVLHLCGPAWEDVTFEDERVTVGAGCDFTRIVKKLVADGFAGLENLAGIPGTLGGIIRMNAGGKYGCIADYVESVQLCDPTGTRVVRSREEVGFRYRGTALADCIVLGATLRLRRGTPAEIYERYRAIWSEKYATQPPLSHRSSGCIFKNPPKHAAGALIDRVGLKGTRVGGAEISTKHANFIVASEDSRAQDVLDLIAIARDRVRAETGVTLETEVELW